MLRLLALAVLAVLVGASAPPAALASTRPVLLWHDEFNGPAGALPNPANWTYDLGNGGWGNHELENYTDDPANVQTDGQGHLVITAIKNADGSYSSGRIKTQGRFSFRYGTVSARISLPAGQGLWPAFWMVGNSIDTIGWPACGEIDIMELLGQDPHLAYGHIHVTGPGRDASFGTGYRSAHTLANSFHIYSAHWTPTKVTFAVDGHSYYSIARSQVKAPARWSVSQPMFIILNLAVGGTWPGSPNASTVFPARMRVDWVRVSKP